MSHFFDSLKELLFPAHCLECGCRLPCWDLPLFCPDCLAGLDFIGSPRCRACGLPFQCGQDHLCGKCLTKPYAFDLARAAFHYRMPVISCISSLKFNGALTGVSTLANLARSSSGYRDMQKPDLILPVPLHNKRLRTRGFNQAIILAKACFPELKTCISTSLLFRNRPTPPQTNLSGSQRRKNLSGAFSVRHPELLQGKHILLFDDVFTTGSTVHECAKVLRKTGVKRIEVFTLARAV